MYIPFYLYICMSNNNTATSQLFDIILEQYMNHLHTSPTRPSRSTPIRSNMTAPMQNRRITVLDNIIYEYNRNMHDYQENMRHLIDIVGQIQPLQEDSASRTTVPSASVPLSTRLSASVPNASRRSTPNSSTYDLFSYFIYPSQSTDLTDILTDDQINIATEAITFSENMRMPDETDNRCPITMETFIEGDELLQISECRHRFKKNALMNWFNRDPRCPLCRYNLHNYNPQANPPTQPVEPSEEVDPTQPLDPTQQLDPIISLNHPILPEDLPRNPYSTTRTTNPRQNTINRAITNVINSTINSEEVREGIDYFENSPQIMQQLTNLFSGLLQPVGPNSDITYTFEFPVNQDSSMNYIN
jgi:hypothetical protein